MSYIEKALNAYNSNYENYNSKEIEEYVNSLCKKIVESDEEFIISSLDREDQAREARWSIEKVNILLSSIDKKRTILKYKFIFKKIIQDHYDINYCHILNAITINKGSMIYTLYSEELDKLFSTYLECMIVKYMYLKGI